jgi:hypothetical protein
MPALNARPRRVSYVADRVYARPLSRAISIGNYPVGASKARTPREPIRGNNANSNHEMIGLEALGPDAATHARCRLPKSRFEAKAQGDSFGAMYLC